MSCEMSNVDARRVKVIESNKQKGIISYKGEGFVCLLP